MSSLPITLSAMDTEVRVSLCPSCDRSISCTTTVFPAAEDFQPPQDHSSEAHGTDDASPLSRARRAKHQACAIKSEIARLKSLTKELKAHHRSLVELSKQQLALVAPVQQLPVELLHEIFLHACADEEIMLRTIPYTILSAMSFSRVCRTWRNIALNDSRLWTFSTIIDLSALASAYSRPRGSWIGWDEVSTFKRLVSLYLSRSGCRPLGSLNISASYNEPALKAAVDEEPKLLPPSIFKHFHRFRDISLTNSVIKWAELRVRASQESLVKSVKIVGHNEPDMSTVLFSGAAHLTSWSQYVDDFVPVNLPLSQLTRIVTGWISYIPAFTALTQCRALKRLELSLYREFTMEEDLCEPEILELPHLVSFRLCVDNPCILDDILDILDTPCLKKLKLSWAPYSGVDARLTDDFSDWEWPKDEFSRFMDETKCKLESFTLEDLCIPPGVEVELRKQLPQSTRIVVEENSGWSDEEDLDLDDLMSEISKSDSESA
ncbi:hypothetical protein BD626DRAFT_503886 [Schizophyllum amplum]|uniref:F-box domain-containing protein n=1 Tax=Schizophyllum amplum TaxID=97359 RepID=A0A550C7W9_9AGAR|nr:hypothetical protein BD626DRAFT_503886 [Auriculariopsis ampla]